MSNRTAISVVALVVLIGAFFLIRHMESPSVDMSNLQTNSPDSNALYAPDNGMDTSIVPPDQSTTTSPQTSTSSPLQPVGVVTYPGPGAPANAQ